MSMGSNIGASRAVHEVLSVITEHGDKQAVEILALVKARLESIKQQADKGWY